ncbi:MAG: chemotaxis protein CheB [Chloroflexi bacterium]|nr:chemotaxis protein CheB [Chloroflexota bacterium]
MPGHDIIVVGASAGGVEALQELARGLPRDLPASVFVVLHIGSQPPEILPRILSRKSAMPCRAATDGEPIEMGRCYLGVPGHHLTLTPGHIRLDHGPKENSVRPAVNALFRSAAAYYGPRVIGVVLSGLLDDGTAGLVAIKRRGGIAIAQDPRDALFPQMPQSAIDNVRVDHIIRVAQLGSLLAHLASTPAPDEIQFPLPQDMDIEAKIGQGVISMDKMPKLGTPSRLTCPDCGGTLWEMHEDDLMRFRCQTGHAYSPETLAAKQSELVEGALWAALRAMDENIALARRVAQRARKHNRLPLAESFEEKAHRAERQADTLRAVLTKNAPESEMAQINVEEATTAN